MVGFLHASHSFFRHRSRFVLPNDGLLEAVEIKLTHYRIGVTLASPIDLSHLSSIPLSFYSSIKSKRVDQAVYALRTYGGVGGVSGQPLPLSRSCEKIEWYLPSLTRDMCHDEDEESERERSEKVNNVRGFGVG